MMGKGRVPRAFYFSIIAIFTVIPSGSLCGGESLGQVLGRKKERLASFQPLFWSFNMALS